MGLPLFKTPVEPGITAATMERFLASARSSIRRSRLCESRLDPPRRPISDSRRIWRSESLSEDELGDNSRDSNQYPNLLDSDSPSATWNSRVIRIFEDNRERTRPEDNIDSENQLSSNSGQFYSNYETSDHPRSDGTSLQSSRARRSRTNRLRRMAGRHSLLSRPIFYNEFHPRLAPPTSVVNTSLSNIDISDHRHVVSRSGIDASEPDENEISAPSGNSGAPSAIEHPHPVSDTSTQNSSDQRSQNSWQVTLEHPSLSNRSTTPSSEIIWERILRYAPDPEVNSEVFSRVGNTSFADVSSNTSESAPTDKVEGSPSNVDRTLEDTREVEDEPVRQEILGRNSDRWTTYADVVSARDNLLYQPDRVRVSLDDWHHVTPRLGDQDGLIDEQRLT